MGVGGVKGGHQMKVCEALDLVTFLTGLLNSRLRVITINGKPKGHDKLVPYFSCQKKIGREMRYLCEDHQCAPFANMDDLNWTA
jgi:hypothetical protein